MYDVACLLVCLLLFCLCICLCWSLLLCVFVFDCEFVYGFVRVYVCVGRYLCLVFLLFDGVFDCLLLFVGLLVRLLRCVLFKCLCWSLFLFGVYVVDGVFV